VYRIYRTSRIRVPPNPLLLLISDSNSPRSRPALDSPA
jgi:hypothetical protein